MSPVTADRCPYPYRVKDGQLTLRPDVKRALNQLPADAAARVKDGVCGRETASGDHVDLCVWHRYGEKSAADLVADTDTGPPERLEGANLRTDLDDELSFAGCRLTRTDFAGASLRGADFAGAHLEGAQFYSATTDESADLAGADLAGADLRHADLRYTNLRDADLSGAILDSARLTGARMDNATLSGATLIQTVASEARFVDADLTDCDLWNADLSGARLNRGDLTDADLRNVSLKDARLEQTDFVRTNLERATLTDARTADALFRNVLVDTETRLTDDFDRSFYEKEADLSLAGRADPRHEDRDTGSLARVRDAVSRFWTRLRIDEERDPNRLSKAINAYRTYQRLIRENDLQEEIPRYRTREKHAKRKRSLSRGGWRSHTSRRYLLRWGRLSLARWTILYGESPWRVGWVSLLVVVAFAFLYPLWGIQVDNEVVDYSMALGDLPTVIETALYYSFSKFVTVTPPVATGVGPVRLLAAIEAFLGTFLLALLVFVLGRRMTW